MGQFCTERVVWLLAAGLLLVSTVPLQAAAGNTVRDDDGEMDTFLDLDAGDDTAVKRLVVSLTDLTSGSPARLLVYGKADGCVAVGPSHALTVNGLAVSAHDPCSKWGTSSYTWASFDVPVGLLATTNVLEMREIAGSWGDRNAFLGVDLDTDLGRSDIHQSSSYFNGDIGGELMWYLVFGSASPPRTIRDDDNERDTSLDMDYVDDFAVKRLEIPIDFLTGARTATLWVFAKADACGATGAAHQLTANGNTVENYDPCSKWTTSGYAWAPFAIPLGSLSPGETNSFEMSETAGDWTDRNVFLGVDSDSDQGRSDIYQSSSSYEGNIDGELMWYLAVA